MPSRFILATAILFASFTIASGQDPLPSVETILNADGTLDLGKAFDGPLSVEGYRMELGANGAPRFVPEANPWPQLMGADDQIEGDQYWDDRFGPPGIDGPVYTLLLHQGVLYVGGDFLFAGSTLANNIAQWDGTTWSALETGTAGPVYAMTVRADQLIVAGGFRSAGPEVARNIAQWGLASATWSRLGDYEGFNDTVYALATIGGDVYIGGRFTRTVAGTPVNASRVARWNGARMQAVGSGVDRPVRAMAVRDTMLFVGGEFLQAGGTAALRIATWNGSAWEPLGAGFNGDVRSILADSHGLVVGGGFTMSGASSMRHIAQWNPVASRWESVSGGFDAPVNALARLEGELYAAGRFRFASSNPQNSIARLVSGAWTELDAGIGDKNPPEVFALAASDTSLYVGGRFLIAGTLTAYNLAEWTGTAWRTIGKHSRTASSASGVDGGVFAIVVHGDNVYIGGDFEHAGGVPARHVARWDAVEAQWSPLGSGVGGSSAFVRSMEIVDGDLYVGGIFDLAGGIPVSGIARWNITSESWSALGGGVGGLTPYVFALHEHAGDLYVAGAFTQAGGVEANRIAKWDGATWSPIGTGVRGDTVYVYVTAISFLADQLYIGGTFTYVADRPIPFLARWDGISWNEVGGGVNAQVSALESIGGKLYVGGDFTRTGSDSARHAAIWDGSGWSRMGTGTDGPVQAFAQAPNGAVFVAGDFQHAGPATAANIAIWDGSLWSGAGGGTNGPIRTIALASEDLYVGGDFSVAGGLKVNNIARFDGVGYSALGSDAASGLEGLVRAVAVQGPNVYIGGEFTSVGGIRASNVARWNGSTWSTLGRGRLNGVDGPVFSLAADTNDLFVGGSFLRAGGADIPFVARWDGSGWSSLGNGLSGSSPFVFALHLYGDDLYVGGAFRYAGGVDVNKVARWSRSSSTWHPLGEGVGGGSYYTYVSALARDGSDLYVGGNFTSAGNEVASNIAIWNGASWRSIQGYGTNGAVYQILPANGLIYVGGNFTQAGQVRAGYIAVWDGGAWSALGTGMNRPVYDMAIIEGTLIAGGTFTIAGAYNSSGIARWRNNEWFPLGRGVTKKDNVGTVLAMVTNPYDTSLWVGGDFTVAGGNPSYYVGRWAPSLGVAGVVPQTHAPRLTQLAMSIAPNPIAGHAATICVRVEDASAHGHLRIDLYDFLGRQIALVYDGRMEEKTLCLPLTVDLLPSGTYLLRASHEGHRATEQLVVW